MLSLLIVLFPLNPKESTIAASGSEKFTAKEIEVLKSLTTLENEIHLNYKNNHISNENGDLEESTSYNQDISNKKIKTSALSNLLEKDPSLIQIQIFDIASNKQIMYKNVKSLDELEGLTFETPKYLLEENKDNAVFQADYMVIISTKDHVGFYDFTRFYINDFNKVDTELLSGILQYIESTDMQNGLNIEFIRREETMIELDITDSNNLISCIACVGPIYTVGSKEYYNRWVNIAQVHAIKGVDTTFTISSKKSSTVAVQSKTVVPGGTVSSTGSLSNNITMVETYPKLTATTLTAYGRHAQQEVQMVKTEYIAKNNSDRYTTVRRNKYIGGTRFGSYVGGNGKSYNSVSGRQYAAGSQNKVTQENSLSFSNQASTTVYGISVGVTVTLNKSTQNEWFFNFKKGYGYTNYKVYGKYFNLTAH